MLKVSPVSSIPLMGTEQILASTIILAVLLSDSEPLAEEFQRRIHFASREGRHVSGKLIGVPFKESRLQVSNAVLMSCSALNVKLLYLVVRSVRFEHFDLNVYHLIHSLLPELSFLESGSDLRFQRTVES